ncbi:putative heat shock protein 70 family protein, partial [Tanacetum coccineum]
MSSQKVIRIINEPTAAAIWLMVIDNNLDNCSGLTRKRTVLVFDLGGGTFDVSLLTIEEGGTFKVKAVAGDTHLGGQDFDNGLVKYCAEDFKKKWKKDVTGNERAMGRLKVACEKAKRSLSYATQASIELEVLYEGIDFSMNLTRAKFEELNMNFFTECIKKVRNCLADAEVKKENVDDVILVGGSTRIPKVRCMLQDFFDGKELCQGINPDEAVAYGAAIMAAKVSGQTTKMLKELVLVDVTPMSLGIESLGGIMAVVIPRNTPIPTQNSVTCLTVTDNQTAIINKVYQGERTRSTDNYLLGQFRITGIPPAPKGVSEVEDTFKIDANGILTVTSKVVSTGKTEKLTVTNHSGRFSQQEIEKMVKDAEKYKLEDQEYKRKVDAFNDWEDFLYVVKKKIMMNRYDISTEVLRNIEYAVNDATEWLSNNKDATIEEIEAKKFQ